MDITNAAIIKEWGSASREAAEQHGDDGDFARQHLLNPALFSLLGDIEGKKILDAGCGQGYLCRLLARRGAIVTGVEPAESWYAYAQEREQQEQLSITYIQEDLSTFSQYHDTFDVVIANMVFMDIPDYQTAMHNCIVSLKCGGSFLFSITHPCFEESSTEWNKKGYVEIRGYLQEFAIPSQYGYWFHRPLSTYLNFMLSEGCTLQRLVEPQLSEEVVKQYGTQHTRNVHVPQFFVVYAQKG